MGDKTEAKERKSITEMLKEKKKERIDKPAPQQVMPTGGGLSDSSIFGGAPVKSKEAKEEERKLAELAASKASLAFRDPKRDSWNWPRKHAWRQHIRRGRLTKEELILRTERSHTCQSHFLKTSMKKLAPLARQIAGKTLEDAMAQMEFSLKGPAKEILEHLKEARDEAILKKGMNPKEMYVSQAWVGKGQYGMDQKRRARGRRDMLRLPYTRTYARIQISGSCADKNRYYGRVEGGGYEAAYRQGEGDEGCQEASLDSPSQQAYPRPAAILPVVENSMHIDCTLQNDSSKSLLPMALLNPNSKRRQLQF